MTISYTLRFATLSRRLETEINEKLQDVHNKLLQANVDQRESERDAKMKETLATLQRIFPGQLMVLSAFTLSLLHVNWID